jgi:hypothetical protein
MKKYLYLYVSPKDSNTDMSPEGMKAWMDYYTKLGEKLVDGGAPFGNRQYVGKMCATKDGDCCKDAEGKDGECCNGGGSCCGHSVTSGYSIVKAENMEEAVKMTEGHPGLSDNCDIEVIELIDLPM